MTEFSQNGLSANDPTLIHSVTIPGTDVAVNVRKGPVGDLLVYAAARWHHEVERLRAPDGVLDCWGYAQRTIRGSSTVMSNHASGSAIDLRARSHPLGTDPAWNFTPAQIAAVRRIVDDAKGALRWGGDYGVPARGGITGSRPDGMHLEVLGTEQGAAHVLAHLQGDDMPLTQADADLIVDTLLRRPVRDLYPTTPFRDITVLETLQWAAANAGRTLDAVKHLGTAAK